MLCPLNNAISSFSFRQRLDLSDERLKREHFLRIFHFILGTKFLRFIFQNSFESSVSFLYTAKLNDVLWLLYLFFKCGFYYTYINVLAVGLFTACDGGFVYNIFQLNSFRLVDKALSLCSCTFVRLGMVDFDVKHFYCDC